MPRLKDLLRLAGFDPSGVTVILRVSACRFSNAFRRIWCRRMSSPLNTVGWTASPPARTV